MSFRIDTQNQCFTYDKSVDKKPDAEVLPSLTAQVQAIESNFSVTIQTMLQNLYQRQSERDKIATKHPKWHRQLTVQYQAIIDEEIKLQKILPQIPLLDTDLKKALALILQIVVMHYSIKRTTKELEVVLGASEHQESLKLYKDTLKAYEALVVKPNHEASTDELVALFNASQKHFASIDKEHKLPFLVQEIDQLNREICESTLATITQLQCAVKDTFCPVYKRLENLKATVTQAQPAQILTVDPRPEVQKAILETYLQKTSAHPLPQEESFRNGAWFRTIRFAQIIPQIDTLDSLARAISALRATLQTRIVSHLTGNSNPKEPEYISKEDLRYFNSLISGLEGQLHAQRLHLSKMEVTDKVRAGLYYVSRLRATLQNVRMYADIAKRLVKGAISYHVQAIHSIRTLAVDNRVSSLYNAIKAALLCPKDVSCASSFTKVMSPITSTIINDSIALLSKKILSLSKAEVEVPHKLFAKLPLKYFYEQNERMHALPSCLRSYFIKGFLEKTYFTKAPNPEFEAALYLFSYDPEYKHSLAAALRDDQEFKELYTAYKGLSDIGHLAKVVEIRTLLTAMNLESPTVTHAAQYKIQQLISELEEVEAPTSGRLSWIKEQAAIEQCLAPKIAMALFATDAEKRQSALAIAGKSLETADPKQPILPHIAFKLFVEKSEPHTSHLLTFFTDYLTHPEFYRTLYDTQTLETALAKFTLIEPKILTPIATKRTMKHFTLWQKMATLPKENTLQVAQSLFQTAGLRPQDYTSTPLTHQAIANLFYTQLL
ncbi:MAG: hypothetical protein LLF94_01705 [Chlamydiales bacterium]|nr:hypothetical protein [Chlamydiales bacterium]